MPIRCSTRATWWSPIETDAGITGIGEGGSKDTLEQCAGRLIGQDPHYIERLWQDMSRAFFYPPGREKMHALGALDLALWDIRGKVLKLPVHAMLGGMVRNYLRVLQHRRHHSRHPPGHEHQGARAADHGGGLSRVPHGRGRCAGQHHVQHARAAQSDVRGLRAGARRRRQERRLVHRLPPALRSVRRHPRLRPDQGSRAVTSSKTRFAPRRFNEDLPILRQKVNVPLAAGEEWGNRWDFNKLVENHDIDYLRATLPNVGGITEMMKIAAICETHFVGIVPHFTGPDRHRRAGNALGTFSGPGADGVQLSAAARFRICRCAWTSRKASSTRTTGPAWAWSST